MKSPLRHLKSRSGGYWPLSAGKRKVQSPFSEAESGDSPLDPQAAGGAGSAGEGACATRPSGLSASAEAMADEPRTEQTHSATAENPGAAPTPKGGDRARRPGFAPAEAELRRGKPDSTASGIYIIDVETQHLIGDRPINQLGVACLCVYDVAGDAYAITAPECAQAGAPAPQWTEWMGRIGNADLVVGYNVQFDLEVLSPWLGKVWPLWAPVLLRRTTAGKPAGGELGPNVWDLLLAIRKASRNGVAGSLGDVAFRTLGETKLGQGAHAPALWRAQRYADLHTYCMNDVRLVRNLLRQVKQHGYVMTASGRVNVRLPRILEEAI